MKRATLILAVASLLFLNSRPAYAWDEFGHHLIARIAWEEMTPAARARSLLILANARFDTRLRPGPGALSPTGRRAAFVAASAWADEVRKPDPRHVTYDIPKRHFTDLFWRQDTDFGPVLPDGRPESGDLLRDLPVLRRHLVGSNPDAAAVALAWILHLVGDIHQPLHASGRVTPIDRNGDKGGNLFCLEPPVGGRCRGRRLHSLWDRSMTGRVRRSKGESEQAHLDRVAMLLIERHPRTEFTTELGQTDPRRWAEASVRIAQERVYREPLRRNHPAPAAYRLAASRTAEPRIVLAGYRLADLLNRALR